MKICSTLLILVAWSLPSYSGFFKDSSYLANSAIEIRRGDGSPTVNSVIISQLPTEDHQDQFLVRDFRNGRWDLYRATLSSGTFVIQGGPLFDVFDTSLAVHSNAFVIDHAYDPSVVYYRGTYWVAFECHSRDFATYVNFATASICMGPINVSTWKIDRSRTRVIVMGGGNFGTLEGSSGSVPKLIVHNGKLHLFWTRVQLDRSTAPPTFLYTDTFASEIIWINGGRDPAIWLAPHQTLQLAFGWQEQHFVHSLSRGPASSYPNNSTADVFDVRRLTRDSDNREVFLYTAAIGGSMDPAGIHGHLADQPCLTPIVGYSELGCYRMNIFEHTPAPSDHHSPLIAAVENEFNIPLGLQYDYNPSYPTYIAGQDPGHEYSRFYIESGKVKMIGKFMGDSQLRSFEVDGYSATLPKIRSNLVSVPGQNTLRRDEFLVSPNELYVLHVDGKGFEILYTPTNETVWRCHRPNGTDPLLTVQSTDGHFVFYPTMGSPAGNWASGAYDSAANGTWVVQLQTDGNLVQLKDGIVRWHAGTHNWQPGDATRSCDQ